MSDKRRHNDLRSEKRPHSDLVDTWRGVGLLAVGLHRVGYDLSLIQHADEGWNATFFITGRMHSAASETSSWRLSARSPDFSSSAPGGRTNTRKAVIEQ